MKQSRIQFDELPDDPVQKAEQDTVWWLVNRIRSQSDAQETYRLASSCVTAALGAASVTGRALKLSAAIGILGDALRDWDSDSTTDADRFQAWDALDSQLSRAARETVRPDRAACFHYGRLLFTALREAYAIQKQSNQNVARWNGRQSGRG